MILCLEIYEKLLLVHILNSNKNAVGISKTWKINVYHQKWMPDYFPGSSRRVCQIWFNLKGQEMGANEWCEKICNVGSIALQYLSQSSFVLRILHFRCNNNTFKTDMSNSNHFWGSKSNKNSFSIMAAKIS